MSANSYDLPRVGIMYDLGAASAGEIAAAASGVCCPVLLCDFALPAVAKQAALLRATSKVIDISGKEDAEVAALLRSEGISWVTTFSETQLLHTGRVAAHARIPYHSARTLELCTDKHAQRRALQKGGLPSVAQAVISAPRDLGPAVDLIGLPSVLKPVRGVGSRQAYLLRNLADVEEVYNSGVLQDEQFVLETFLEGDPSIAGPEWGDYVSVEGLTDDDGYHPISVTGKMPFADPFRETGIMVPSTLPPGVQAECVGVAERAVQALGIDRGVTHTELKLTRAGPGVIEVNARVGGYVPGLLKRCTGFDLVAAELRSAIGRPVDVPQLEFGAVEFQYFVQPPTDVHRVKAIEGFGSLRQLPGVLRVERGLGEGDKVDPGRGTSTFLVTVHGSAANHEALRVLVNRIEDVLHVEYE